MADHAGVWWGLLVSVALLLSACAAGPSAPGSDAPDMEKDFPGLMGSLEGRYENGFQVSLSPETAPQATLTISRVQSEIGDYLLADLSTEHASSPQSWMIRSDRQADQPALAVHALTTSQIARPSAELLVESANLIREDCLIPARWTQGHLTAVSKETQCRYTHPLLGELVVGMSMEYQNDQLTWHMMDGAQDQQLVFERMAQFQVRAQVFIEDEQQQTGAWEDAVAFILSSDGQTWPLVNRRGQPLGFRLKLGRAFWKNDQRPDLELQVLQAESDVVQALSRAPREAKSIVLDEPWIKLNLNRQMPPN